MKSGFDFLVIERDFSLKESSFVVLFAHLRYLYDFGLFKADFLLLIDLRVLLNDFVNGRFFFFEIFFCVDFFRYVND